MFLDGRRMRRQTHRMRTKEEKKISSDFFFTENWGKPLLSSSVAELLHLLAEQPSAILVENSHVANHKAEVGKNWITLMKGGGELLFFYRRMGGWDGWVGGSRRAGLALDFTVTNVCRTSEK